MTRLERKNRTDILFKGCGGLTDAYDDVIKEGWRINDAELDWMCEFSSDEVVGALTLSFKTYADKRDGIELVNKALEEYGKASNNPS